MENPGLCLPLVWGSGRRVLKHKQNHPRPLQVCSGWHIIKHQAEWQEKKFKKNLMAHIPPVQDPGGLTD